jgi:hypothetical protein
VWRKEKPVERIEIEGNKVFLYRDADPPVVDRQVALEDFLREIAIATRRPGRGNHLLLPPGVRIIKMDGTATVCCIEQPPQVRLVRWSAAQMGKGGEYQMYRLAFPYIVYLFLFFQASFEDMRVYYRVAPLQSPDDILLSPNLWNVQADPAKPSACRACLRGRPEDLRERPLVEQVTMLLDFFWSTGFNTDIVGNCFERATALDTRIASLKAWEAASETDPFFPLHVPWEQLKLTVGQAVDYLVETGPQHRRAVADASDLATLMYRVSESK